MTAKQKSLNKINSFAGITAKQKPFNKIHSRSFAGITANILQKEYMIKLACISPMHVEPQEFWKIVANPHQYIPTSNMC